MAPHVGATALQDSQRKAYSASCELLNDAKPFDEAKTGCYLARSIALATPEDLLQHCSM
jgi:hypothetical protein